MKHKFLTILLALVTVLCLCFGLATCGGLGGNGGIGGTGNNGENENEGSGNGEDGHVHSANYFEVNDNEHWKSCTVCGKKFSAGNHAFNADNVCEDCGYTPIYTQGLNYTLDEETSTYSATGVGEAKGKTEIIIPAYYNGKAVTSIGERVFYGCRSLESITIPNNVTSIGDDAFWACSGLEKVIITDLSAWCKIDFTYREANPLYYAHHLYLGESEIINLIIPSDAAEIKSYAFYGGAFTSVKVSYGVTSIGRQAFMYCSSLTSITIPDSVTSIGGSAFSETAFYNNQSNWGSDGVLYIGNHLIEANNTIFGSYFVRANTKTIADGAFV